MIMLIDEKNYVDKAEKVIDKLSHIQKTRNGKRLVDKAGNPVYEDMITTSKIRNLLAMAADIYNLALDCKDDKLPDELSSKIDYMRIRFVYESGRETKVKELVEAAGILEILKQINVSKKNYILFYHYMEALVAFKRFYNKNDD